MTKFEAYFYNKVDDENIKRAIESAAQEQLPRSVEKE